MLTIFTTYLATPNIYSLATDEIRSLTHLNLTGDRFSDLSIRSPKSKIHKSIVHTPSPFHFHLSLFPTLCTSFFYSAPTSTAPFLSSPPSSLISSHHASSGDHHSVPHFSVSAATSLTHRRPPTRGRRKPPLRSPPLYATTTGVSSLTDSLFSRYSLSHLFSLLRLKFLW